MFSNLFTVQNVVPEQFKNKVDSLNKILQSEIKNTDKLKKLACSEGGLVISKYIHQYYLTNYKTLYFYIIIYISAFCILYFMYLLDNLIWVYLYSECHFELFCLFYATTLYLSRK